MKVRILIVISVLNLVGCASSSEEPLSPSGSDKLPKSPCASCEGKKVFYKNGHWVTEDRRQRTEDR